MAKRPFLFLIAVVLISGAGFFVASAQKSETSIRVVVDMVQLNVAVTDNKGNYVTGLRPQDFEIVEDKIPQKMATFGEGSNPTRSLLEIARQGGYEVQTRTSPLAGEVRGESSMQARMAADIDGASVFILFDTSNYMYQGFVFAQDAIASFVRSLEGPDRVALYSYSRDLSRASPLSEDRSAVLRGVRSTVAGDQAALYNALLLTLQDASRLTGRKVVVVFSNGPDDASKVAPEDVAELAQSLGIPVYMISTREARLEPISSAVFERMSEATGGKAYFANNWNDQQKAFASIRDDLAHLYSISYYPQPNPNRGWREIKVRLVGERLKKYNVRTRAGYRPQPTRIAADMPSPALR